MKVVYRISIILNILFAGYILVRGGELLMREYLFTAGDQAPEQMEQMQPESALTSGVGE